MKSDTVRRDGAGAAGTCYRHIVETRTSFAAVVLGLTVAACGSNGDAHHDPGAATDASPVACDPLAPRPIALGGIVGVGTGPDGTSYVDAANGVFVSDGTELDRQYVTGTGQAGKTEYLFGFEPAGDSAGAQTLLVDTDDSGTATAMALGAAGSRTFLDPTDPSQTPLTLVDPASVSGLPVVNTPNQISYVGDVANGDVVFATVPLNLDATSAGGGLSIFYGPPENVEERPVTAFQQSLSNNGTVTFLVGDESYVLAFATVPRSDNPLGDFTLESLTPGAGAPLDVTLRSPTPTEPPSDLSFTCSP